MSKECQATKSQTNFYCWAPDYFDQDEGGIIEAESAQQAAEAYWEGLCGVFNSYTNGLVRVSTSEGGAHQSFSVATTTQVQFFAEAIGGE